MPKTATAIAITTGLPILGFEFLLIECANPDDCSRQINRNGGEGSLQGGACLPAMTAIHEPSLQEQFFALPVARSSAKGGSTMATETRETGSLIGSDKVEGTA